MVSMILITLPTLWKLCLQAMLLSPPLLDPQPIDAHQLQTLHSYRPHLPQCFITTGPTPMHRPLPILDPPPLDSYP